MHAGFRCRSWRRICETPSGPKTVLQSCWHSWHHWPRFVTGHLHVLLDKTRNDIAEDQRVEILRGLVSNNPSIRAVHWSELVLSSIGDPGGQAEEEALDGNDVNCI